MNAQNPQRLVLEKAKRLLRRANKFDIEPSLENKKIESRQARGVGRGEARIGAPPSQT